MFLAFSSYVLQLIAPVRFLSGMMATSQQARAGAQRVVELLSITSRVQDRPDARPLSDATGLIEFDHVNFAYHGGEEVLHDISLRIEPGERIAIVGASGSGKSTLALLLGRFNDVTSGQVRIDSRDVREFTLDSLRATVGIVLEEGFLFSTSIRNNIAFGRPEATDDEIEHAAVAAHAHGFIAGLPAGYETVVGERGYTLSGGQRRLGAWTGASGVRGPAVPDRLDTVVSACVGEDVPHRARADLGAVRQHAGEPVLRRGEPVLQPAGCQRSPVQGARGLLPRGQVLLDRADRALLPVPATAEHGRQGNRARRRRSPGHERPYQLRRAHRFPALPRPVLYADPAALDGVRPVAAGKGRGDSAQKAAADTDGDAAAHRRDGPRAAQRQDHPGPRHLRDMDLAAYRHQLGYVPQEPFLFSGTIRSNIAYGRPDAPDLLVERATRAVGAHGFLAGLPHGYHEPVAEQGRSLSAGQRQLLSLARALLVEPAILLLDEATANLDLATEARVQKAMGLVARGRTTLLIAHRLQTARACQRILVVDSGHIVEDGSHAELLALGGQYAQLWSAMVSSASQACREAATRSGGHSAQPARRNRAANAS